LIADFRLLLSIHGPLSMFFNQKSKI
jgi:hypothetical protein